MPRQSISISKPDDEWLKAQIEKEEYFSKSELVNGWIRAKLEKSETSGFTTDTKELILNQSKSLLQPKRT